MKSSGIAWLRDAIRRLSMRTIEQRSFAKAAVYAYNLFAAALILAGLPLSSADAQEFLNPGLAALPGYEAPGIKSGDYLLKGWLSSGVAYDSNILESSSHPIRDYIFFVAPAVDLVHDSGKNIQEVLVSGVSTVYAVSGNDDYSDLFVSLKDTYFISPSTSVYANFSVSDGYERRTFRNFDIPSNAATPVPELILIGTTGFKTISKYFEVGANLSYSAEQFGDVQSLQGFWLDQQFRNERDLLFDSYITWQIFKYLRSNFVVQAGDIEYKLQTRNYDQWRVADALTVDLTSKTSIGVLFGLREQYLYNDPLVHLGLLAEYELQAEWRPTQLLTLRAAAGYRDLGVDYVQGIYAGGFAPHASFALNYFIRRDLQFSTSLTYEKRYLAGDADVENLWNYQAAITYELSSYAGLSFLYNLQQWNSRDPLNTFNENIFQSSLRIRF
jgi:hypothetical protein